jgi:hypothetical protein
MTRGTRNRCPVLGTNAAVGEVNDLEIAEKFLSFYDREK